MRQLRNRADMRAQLLEEQSGATEALTWHVNDLQYALTLSALPVAVPDSDRPHYFGIPFGTLGRLLLIYVQTAVRKTRSATLSLGDSITELRAALDGKRITGGERGTGTMLHNQLLRVANCALSVTDRRFDPENAATRTQHTPIAVEHELAWTRSETGYYRATEATSLTVTPSLVDALTERDGTTKPIPLERDVLLHRAMQKSPRAWDCYLWLRARLYRLQTSHTQQVTIPITEFANKLQMPGRLTGGARKQIKAVIDSVTEAWPRLSCNASHRNRPYDISWIDEGRRGEAIVLRVARDAPDLNEPTPTRTAALNPRTTTTPKPAPAPIPPPYCPPPQPTTGSVRTEVAQQTIAAMRELLNCPASRTGAPTSIGALLPTPAKDRP